jgi:hypothetical protein
MSIEQKYTDIYNITRRRVRVIPARRTFIGRAVCRMALPCLRLERELLLIASGQICNEKGRNGKRPPESLGPSAQSLKALGESCHALDLAH